jgi:oligopeptide/dipeptide ABC transporter ATP-binding protein
MFGGQVLESGSVRQVFAAPQHPYTRGLLHAIPSLGTNRRQPLANVAPQPAWAQQAPVRQVAPGHWVRENAQVS